MKPEELYNSEFLHLHHEDKGDHKIVRGKYIVKAEIRLAEIWNKEMLRIKFDKVKVFLEKEVQIL